MSGVNRENTGDYGIRYHITVKTKGSGNYKLYINPMGGVYMGTFEIGQNEKAPPHLSHRRDSGKGMVR